MARFVIDLGNIELGEEATQALNEELQKVALSHVAKLRIEKPLAFKLPRPFPWGIILGPDFDDILKREKQLGDALGRLR